MQKVYLIISIALLSACQILEDKPELSFYHWKSQATMSPAIATALSDTDCERVYMHYFDVIQAKAPGPTSDGVFPTYVLTEVDTAYNALDIVPVIYISNEVFMPKKDSWNKSKKRREEVELSERLAQLIHQISTRHFNQAPVEVQIDCDWTEASREAYFTFLEQFTAYYNVSATIRLHQVTYADRTGVPPVQRGALMLYNMGDFKDMEANSIINPEIVDAYIHTETRYPLPLNIALPLFSQTVIRNSNEEYRLSTECNRAFLEQDHHFKQVAPELFEVVKDTTYSGFFLSRGYLLKLEETETDDIVSSYQLIRESQLQINDIIFYHLDDSPMTQALLTEVLQEL